MGDHQQPVKFWLKDRNVVGVFVSSSPTDGTLAEYRGSLYVVRDGSAKTIGTRLQFTKNTLPLPLKRAFGLVPQKPVREKKSAKKESGGHKAHRSTTHIEESLMSSTKTGETGVSVIPEMSQSPKPSAGPGEPPATTPPAASAHKKRPVKSKKIGAEANLHQVACKCPYCVAENIVQVRPEGEGFIMLQGRGSVAIANPFFTVCGKCKEQFAVKLVPTITYQAQIAGFK